LHEIGILFANYILRARNHSVVYLGQSLPFDELLIAYEVYQPDYIFSVFTSEPNTDLINDYLSKMSKDLPKSKIYLTGYQALQPTCSLPDNINLLMDFQSLIDLAENA
jgi:hypothetical protein